MDTKLVRTSLIKYITGIGILTCITYLIIYTWFPLILKDIKSIHAESTSLPFSTQYYDNVEIDTELEYVHTVDKINTLDTIVSIEEFEIIENIVEDTVDNDHVEISKPVNITDGEIHELAALVTLEAGGESFECMKGVVSVVINRAKNADSSIHDILYAPNQFSPAAQIPYTTGSELAYQAVYDVLNYGPIFPSNVMYFRAYYYHSWSSNIVPYSIIDNTYFSADIRIGG